MKLIKRIVLTAAILSLTASPKLVARNCMKKLLQIAGNMATSGTFFDWTDHIIEEFPYKSVPLIKRSCISEEGKLHSFRLVMQGYSWDSNIISDAAGPSEYGDCHNVVSDVQDFPTSGRIYYDNDRVQGVRFFYDGTTDYFQVGKEDGDYITASFNTEQSFIGFYGTQGYDRINQLGFLVQNRTCSEFDDGTWVPPEEDNTMLFAIVGGSGAIVLLLTVILVVILCRPKPVLLDEYQPKNKVAEIGEERIEDFSDD